MGDLAVGELTAVPVRAVLLDAFGTIVGLDPPLPRLTAQLAAEGFVRPQEAIAAALEAEMRFYRANHDRDRAGRGNQADTPLLAPPDHAVAGGQPEGRSAAQHHGVDVWGQPLRGQQIPLPGPGRAATDLSGGHGPGREEDDGAAGPGRLVGPVADPHAGQVSDQAET